MRGGVFRSALSLALSVACASHVGLPSFDVHRLQPAAAVNLGPTTVQEPVGLLAFCSNLDKLQRECDGSALESASSLLLRYCQNAVLPDPKYRRIRLSNKAFRRALAPHPAAAACLAAVGFKETHEATPDDAGALVLGEDVDGDLLRLAAAAIERLLAWERLRGVWPSALADEFNATFAALFIANPDLLEELSSELEAPHVPTLLGHGSNLQRVKTQLSQGIDGARSLSANLQGIRFNISASAAAGSASPPKGSAAAQAAGSRVVEVASMEHWYDTLLGATGVVVAAFGAEWCSACKEAEPLFDALSMRPAYADVTFLHVDADRLPVLIGDQMVDAFPTFKFYRSSAEDALPVVGADIDEIQQRLDEILT